MQYVLLFPVMLGLMNCIFFHKQNTTFSRNEFYLVIIVKSSDLECVTGERFDRPHTKDSNFKTIAGQLFLNKPFVFYALVPNSDEGQ